MNDQDVQNPFRLRDGEDAIKHVSSVTRLREGKRVVTAIYAYVDPRILKLSPYQPRVQYDLTDLIHSIDQYGIKEEIQVNERANGDLVITDGARRVAAAIQLKLSEVPIIIKKLTDREEQEAVLVSNLVHKDLTPIEVAHALKMYKDRWDATNVDLGKLFFPHLSQRDSSGKSSAITSASQKVGRLLKLIELPEEVQALIDQGYSPEKGYFLTLLKFDRDETEFPDWHRRRAELQVELARSNIPVSVLKERVRALTEDEKNLRQTVQHERDERKNLLETYNHELITAVHTFSEFTEIPAPPFTQATEFDINVLKKKKDALITRLREGYTSPNEIQRRVRIIDLLEKLLPQLQAEPIIAKETDEIVPVLKTVREKVRSVVKTDTATNRELDKRINEISARWNHVSITHRKIMNAFGRPREESLFGD